MIGWLACVVSRWIFSVQDLCYFHTSGIVIHVTKYQSHTIVDTKRSLYQPIVFATPYLTPRHKFLQATNLILVPFITRR